MRDSSLAAGTQAVLAAEVGHLALAYDYLGEAALMDLDDLERNTRDGIHIASLAGACRALVEGFGGMRTSKDTLSFAPRLPDRLSRLTFNLYYRARRLRVIVPPTSVSYAILAGAPLRLIHHGEPFTATREAPIIRPIPPAPVRPRPRQPLGRKPNRHRVPG